MDNLKIPTYKDCLDLVENNDCFSHSTQELKGKKIHSFKYNFIPDESVWDSKFSLNMRGITFIDEKLVALPFHKFFNINENKYTKDISLDDIEYALSKEDGSLISMFLIDDKLYCKSMKSVFSDVSVKAMEYLSTRKDIIDLSHYLLGNNLSPMFEYVDPNSKIVLHYNELDLIFLGARDMRTGEIRPSTDIVVEQQITTPKLFFTKDQINEYLKQSNIEGVVLTMKDGRYVKIKTEEYTNIHRLISNISSDKSIVSLIFNKKLDDVKSGLVKNNLKESIKTVERVEKEFFSKVAERMDNAKEYISNNKGLSKKDIALSLKDVVLKNDVFSVLSSKSDRILYSIYKSY